LLFDLTIQMAGNIAGEQSRTTCETGDSVVQGDRIIRQPSTEYLIRQARSARYTITSTFTSYSFFTVNSTKTAFLVSSLFCIPGGFRTC
jgi:hypothetical protein